MEDLTFVSGDAAGGKQSAIFRLGDERTDDGDTSGVCRDGVVQWAVVVFVAEEVMAAGDAAGTGSGEIGGVREDAEDHGGGAEDFLSIGVGGHVAEEAVEAGDGGGSGVGLLGG